VTNTRRSLVLVTVDCLRADHCGFHGYQKPTTPFLDSLANESFIVPTAVIAGGPTYYSLPAIFTSRMPLALGRDVIGIAPGEKTLATALHECGYATAAFTAANPYISARFGYDQGFDLFRDFEDFEATGPGSRRPGNEAGPSAVTSGSRLNRVVESASAALGLTALYKELYFQYCARIIPAPAGTLGALQVFPSARALVKESQSWLESLEKRPFFLWLHLMEPHSPYYPPEDAFRELTGRRLTASRARYLNAFWNRGDLDAAGLRRHRNEIVELYDAGILAADREIARLVSCLKAIGVWNDCVFAITADHGEEFLEHGRRYHAPVGLAEEFVHVPLIVRVPEQSKKNVPESPFSHLDLAPTLLDFLGVEAPRSFRGRSLYGNLRNGEAWEKPAMMECVHGCTNPYQNNGRRGERLFGVRDKRYKLTFRLAPGAIEDLYDLETDAEEENILPENVLPDIRKQFLRIARKELGWASETDATERLRSRLRDFRLEYRSTLSGSAR
jgi:arylsulfatase A-like enzyme